MAPLIVSLALAADVDFGPALVEERAPARAFAPLLVEPVRVGDHAAALATSLVDLLVDLREHWGAAAFLRSAPVQGYSWLPMRECVTFAASLTVRVMPPDPLCAETELRGVGPVVVRLSERNVDLFGGGDVATRSVRPPERVHVLDGVILMGTAMSAACGGEGPDRPECADLRALLQAARTALVAEFPRRRD